MKPLPPQSDGAYEQYLAALISGDRHFCETIFQSWLDANIDLKIIYQNLIQRSLYEVGGLWESGKVSVATEHLATAITENLLNLAYPRLFSQPRSGKSAVISCIANEYHQIGGKMVADMFELNGWRGYFVGANTPIASMVDLIQEKRPDTVAMSLTIYHQLDHLLESAAAVRSKFPKLPILVGGQAFRFGRSDRVERIPGVRYLASLNELETWLKAPTTSAN